VLFLVDLGPSMAFGARVALKSVVAARAAALRVPFLEEVLALQPAAGERKALRHRWTRVAPWLAWLLLTFAATQPQWLGEPVSLPTSGQDLLLAFIAWRLLRQSSGTSAWESQCDPHLLARLLVHRTSHHRLPLLLLAVGWTLAVFALAGPAWQKLPQPVFQAQAARVMVLDLSPSMNAPDLRPSRIDRARFKLLDLLARFREGQTGLVVFAGASFVVSPLTDDTKTIAALLPALAPELMPAPGDHAHAALRMADDLLSQAGIHGQGEIILVTDGYDDPAAVLETVNALRAHGRRVSVLAVGTREGAPIPLPDGGFLKDAAGAIVLPRLDSAALTELARQGDGRFARLSVDDRDIEALLSGQERPGEVRQESSRQRSMDRWREEGPWLVFQPSWIEG
jgi:Ca-activated chloride channel family protein